MIPVVLFFARDYQANFFPLLNSNKYKSVFVVLNKKEKEIVTNNGGKNIICFEEEFDSIQLSTSLDSYLRYSFGCDRNYIGLNLKEREIILDKTVFFWRRILDLYKPQLIINETVAIEVSEVLAIEADRYAIKYLSWMSFSKKNTFYWQVDPFHNSLGSELRKLCPSELYLKEADLFIEGIKSGVERPFYVKSSSPRYSILKLMQNVLSISFEILNIIRIPKLKRRIAYGTSLNLNLWSIKLFFLSVFNFSTKYDNLNDYNKGKELIFYPLHYEPEAVLFYMAYFFDNQVSVIENTLKCLRQNQILVVKEHPQQPGVLLERRFRKIKKRYPNLVFIKGEESTVKILSEISVVITLGSTAGFEALALGKKVINLGKVFYDSFNGVNNCSSFNEVYDLLRGIVPFNRVTNFNYFVAQMLTYVKEGNPFPHDNLYSSENVLSIKKAIENELVV